MTVKRIANLTLEIAKIFFYSKTWLKFKNFVNTNSDTNDAFSLNK